ncbi:MAG: alpha/beta fold hydrolase [Thermoanaerobaculia bacterium]|nr:alpha/beta fold hydrolase [Thermoanaerobaculia bacterium]
MSLHGHFWTLAPRLRARLKPLPEPVGTVPWQGQVVDPELGPLRLTGRLHHPPGAAELVLLVHGLGGSAESPYMIRGARAAAVAGLASLRLNLRGADLSGEDFYHAALTADLEAALADPALVGYDRLFVLGFSLGGHLTLRLATEAPDPRIRAFAAVCSPLDLAATQPVLDGQGARFYRRYLLANLMRSYAVLAARRPVPVPLEEAREIDTFYEFDRRIVAPRHGFDGARDYYRRASVGPRLANLDRPALLIATHEDPMVAAHTVAPSLERATSSLEVRWSPRGGHVGFPRDLDLGLPGPRGLEGQVLGWLLRQG